MNDIVVGKRVLICSAFPYANNFLHLGHMICSHIPADILRRFLVTNGVEVVFLSATDCYGFSNLLTAHGMSKPVREVVDFYRESHLAILKSFQVEYDIFDRTDREEHSEFVNGIFKKLLSKDFIQKRRIKENFCSKERISIPSKYEVCPFCKSKLIEGETEELFLEVNCGKDGLKEWILDGHLNASSIGEALKFSSEDLLLDRSISRTFDYGIKIKGLEKERKIFYVWFEALLGYLSFSHDASFFEEGNVINFFGKDNLYFHSIFFNSLLSMLGFKLPLKMFCSNFLLSKGEKFSKSNNIGLFLKNISSNSSLLESLRAFLFFYNTSSGDRNFEAREFHIFQDQILVEKISNFFFRILSLFYRENQSEKQLDLINNQYSSSIELIKVYEQIVEIKRNYFHLSLEEIPGKIINLFKEANKLVDLLEPWKNKDLKVRDILLFLIINLLNLLQNIFPSSVQNVYSKCLAIRDKFIFPFQIENLDKSIRIFHGRSLRLLEPIKMFERASIVEVEQFLAEISGGMTE